MSHHDKPPSPALRNLSLAEQVLSVNKALSIQSHPDKQLAEKLHAQHPKVNDTRERTASQDFSSNPKMIAVFMDRFCTF